MSSVSPHCLISWSTTSKNATRPRSHYLTLIAKEKVSRLSESSPALAGTPATPQRPKQLDHECGGAEDAASVFCSSKLAGTAGAPAEAGEDSLKRSTFSCETISCDSGKRSALLIYAPVRISKGRS